MTTGPAELLDEGARALWGGEHARAMELAIAARDAGGGAAAYRLIGAIHFVLDEPRDADREMAIAFRVYRDAGALREAAKTAIELAGLHAGPLHNPLVARGWTERARVLLERVGPCVEWGYLELAVLACDRPDAEGLLASAERALQVAIDYGDSDLEAQALADSGLALVTMGRASDGFARLDAALTAVAAGEVHPSVAGICICSMLTACDRSGDTARVEQWTAAVDVLAGDGDRPRPLNVHCRLAYGSVLLAGGRWDEAERLLLDALGPASSPSSVHRALTSAHLARLRIAQGRLDEAAALLQPFEDAVHSCEPLALLELRRGEPALAEAIARRGLQELVGDVARRAPLLALIVQAALARDDLSAAAEAADVLRQDADETGLPELRAEASLAEGRLRLAEGRADDAIAAFRAAVAALAGHDRPLQVARIRLELAVALAPTDRPAATVEARAAIACFERVGAASERDRAAAILRDLGDTARARAREADAAVGSLTGREREVLALVSEGLTNGQIAERLYIAPKTAEHHVGRVLTKLGVRSRAEAAALAVRASAPITPSAK